MRELSHLRRLGFPAASILLGLAAAWLLAEAAVRVRDLDLHAVQKVLYYQTVDLALHEAVSSPLLHYALRPSSQLGAASVGATGLRNPTPPDDATGLRVLFGGGSTVYGTDVADHETLPARLSVHLGGAPVWNLGVSAYTEAQVLERARLWLDHLGNADLVLLMITNPGRRPVLGGAPYSREALETALFWDPGFIDENLPSPWPLPGGVHTLLAQRSPVWRYISASRAAQLPPNAPQWNPQRARALAQEGLRDAAVAAEATVIYVHYPRHKLPCEGCWRGDAEINLARHQTPRSHRDLHPPVPALDAHAQAIAEALRAGGFAE